jgi:2-polyprenyl-3-methyl-5-hydroxy-6-metoxy-1,4-benzoquinol methylase
MTKFSIETAAREYMNKSFPRATEMEKEKMVQDWCRKIDVARAVVKDFENRATDPRGRRILDAGFGSGGFSTAFAEAGAKVQGVEIDKDLVEIARNYATSYGCSPELILYDGKRLPFSNEAFDGAVSVSVLEHVDDPVNYLKEILRVMKLGGYLYLAFPNRLWPRETHTRLWGVSYLPYSLARRVIRWFKRNPLEDNNLHFYTYWDLSRFIKESHREDSCWEIVKESGNTRNAVKVFVKNLLILFGVSYKAFLPHISVILKKRKMNS